MPLELSAMTLFCCVVWAAYAFYVGDAFIGTPNYIGIFLCLAQLALYAAYRENGPYGTLPSLEPLLPEDGGGGGVGGEGGFLDGDGLMGVEKERAGSLRDARRSEGDYDPPPLVATGGLD